MLINAIPKSASTSLLATLGALHDLPARQTFDQQTAPPARLKVLHRYHSDIRQIADAQLAGFRSEQELFKQHIPPTPENLRLLRPVRKVVLLRDPEQIIEAYHRAEQRAIHTPRAEFEGCSSSEQWLSRAREIGLLDDLEWFAEQWAAECTAAPETGLLIRYADLVEHPTRTVNAVEDFFGLPQSANVALSRERFSRGPRYQGLLNRLRRRLFALVRPGGSHER